MNTSRRLFLLSIYIVIFRNTGYIFRNNNNQHKFFQLDISTSVCYYCYFITFMENYNESWVCFLKFLNRAIISNVNDTEVNPNRLEQVRFNKQNCSNLIWYAFAMLRKYHTKIYNKQVKVQPIVQIVKLIQFHTNNW